MSDITFEKGDIVIPDPKMYIQKGEGEVTDVQEDGYVGVRFSGGPVFSFWPQELVKTGKRLNPEVLPVLEKLDKSIEEAKSLLSKLNTLRDGVVALGLTPRP